MTDTTRDELLQGTLDRLVLKALQLGDMHGWGTAAGRGRLAEERQAWNRASRAVELVLAMSA